MMLYSLSRHRRTRLQGLCEETLGPRRLIIGSNRGPAEFAPGRNGDLRAYRGRGGVVSALSALGQCAKLTWVASVMSDGDRAAVANTPDGRIGSPFPDQDLFLRYISPSRKVYHKYYNIISNPLLWFLHHHMWSPTRTPTIESTIYDAWQKGYIPVNRAFADAIVDEAQRGEAAPYIMLHDYHLYLVAGQVRAQIPDAILHHFVHVPWPGPDAWHLLIPSMRLAILKSLCANDILGFQTRAYARNFLHTCEAFLGDAQIDYSNQEVNLRGHTVRVRSYPVSVDVAHLRGVVESEPVRQYAQRLDASRAETTIVRVDRVDPSKNLIRGFRAFDLLLQRHPELAAKVRFLAFLVPSRTYVPEYQRYWTDVTELVDSINTRFGRDDWRPVELFYENNYLQALAGLTMYDILLSNPTVDGMNLVCKEGPLVNRRNGILVLSETTGAHEQLREGVLTIASTDLEGTVRALEVALAMSDEERERRANYLKQVVEEEDIINWLCRQLEDLKKLTAEQRDISVPHAPSEVAAGVG